MPTIDDLKQTMIRVQIAALETLERCMTDPESSGNEKTDKARSTERNRQRMAAAQALIHCRTMFRELRESEAQEHRIAEEHRQASKKAIYERAHLRRLHRQYPGEYDDPDAHAPTPAPSPLAGEGGRRSQSVGRMRGRPEPSDNQYADGATGGSPASAGPNEPDRHNDIARDAPRTSGAKPLTKGSPTQTATRTRAAKRIRSKTRKPKHPCQSRNRKQHR